MVGAASWSVLAVDRQSHMRTLDHMSFGDLEKMMVALVLRLVLCGLLRGCC